MATAPATATIRAWRGKYQPSLIFQNSCLRHSCLKNVGYSILYSWILFTFPRARRHLCSIHSFRLKTSGRSSDRPTERISRMFLLEGNQGVNNSQRHYLRSSLPSFSSFKDGDNAMQTALLIYPPAECRLTVLPCRLPPSM